MPSFPTSSSKSFSSTPVKNNSGKDLHRSIRLKNNDSSDNDNDSTYSLLSPIYHDSFVSDDHLGADACPRQLDTSATQSEDARSISPTRCEPPQRLSDKTATERDHAGASLSAWETWLVYKAKEDRLQMEQNAEEERILKERMQKVENERLEKKAFVEEKIQQWLKIKKEQEQEKLRKENQEKEQIQRQRHKQRETEIKAEKKYNEWLRKKNHEKIEREKREKEETANKKAKEAERRQRAEENFKQWLESTHDKSKPSPSSQFSPRDGYSNISYPLPSYYNPIPWKPINIPPPDKSAKKNSSVTKLVCQKKYQQSASDPFRLRNTVSAGNLPQKR